MIDYVNSVFATQEDVAPVVIALCSETGIDKNETWKTLPNNMKRDAINITIRHFQSEGYSVIAQPGRYVYQFQRSLSRACKIDEVKALQKAAITKKNTVHIPNAIETCLKHVNETIKTEAKIGKGCVAIDLSLISKTFDQSLTHENRYDVYDRVWEILREGKYMVRISDRARATVIWDDELIAYHNKRDEEAALAEAAKNYPQKKRFLWNRK
jgi:hypothetical protein